MIDELLPKSVSVSEIFGDPEAPALPPEEQAIIANAVDKRRREFANGRWCARQALGRLGFAPRPILPGHRGQPGWPSGVVGAITHCDGYRAAVVARQSELAAIGVDAEPAKALPEGVLEAVSLPEERERLRACWLNAPEVPWDRMLFSAKESVYKAWFPMTARRLEFEDASIRFDPYLGTFSARLLVPGWRLGDVLLTRFDGRWTVAAGLVVTAVAVPPASRGSALSAPATEAAAQAGPEAAAQWTGMVPAW